jgi:hypothetical protein
MTARFWPVLIAIAAISVVVLLPRLQVRSRRLFLLRVLFPSWRFFENIGVNSQLHVRWREVDAPWSEWREALVAPQRRWTALFHNPDGNLHFAKQSAVEHLVSEAELRPDGLSESVPYSIVRRIAEGSVLDLAVRSARISEFQFKIVQLDSADGSFEDFLVSGEQGVSLAETRT